MTEMPVLYIIFFYVAHCHYSVAALFQSKSLHRLPNNKLSEGTEPDMLTMHTASD